MEEVKEQMSMFKRELFIFSADWCSNCKPVKETLAKLADEGLCQVTVIDVDTDEGRKKATEYHVRALPTVVNGDGGKIVGAKSEAMLREWVVG